MRSRCIRLLVVVAVAIGLSWATAATAGEPAGPDTGMVPLGVAKLDVTPELPVRMYGYAARKTESEGVAGRLKASALVIGPDEGDGPAVLLCVDCGSVPGDLRQEVFERVGKEIPLKPERFVLCNSHNHSGPDLKGMAGISGEQLEHLTRYRKTLSDKLVKVVLEAAASRAPGRLAQAQGNVGFAANRRVLTDGKWSGFGAVPDAPVDHSLPLLRATGADGKLLAVVVNYACHATTLRGNFRQIHGDWPGCAQEYIEADQPGAVAMITLGCGADADPCPHGTVELCQQHGRAVADEVARLLAGPMRPIHPTLTCRSTTLEIPFLEPPPVAELRQSAEKSWALARLAGLLEQGERPPATASYPLTTWVFGDQLAMVFLSNEVVVDYALRLKRELDADRLWITAYADEVSNYIVSKRLFGEGGYEVRNSLSTIVSFGRPEEVEPAIEDRIVEAVRSLLPASYASDR